MSDVQTFGSLVLGTDVSDAVTLTLQTWFPTYLAMMDRRLASLNLGSLPAPGSYVTSSDPRHWPEDQPPAVVVAVPGTLGQPKRDGSRNYRAFWDVRVIVFVTASDRESTERLAKYYGAAVRLLLLNKGSLGNFAAGTEWYGEFYETKIADRDQRTLGSCENRFSVDVRDVVRALGGPPAPITTQPADWPEATSVKATLTPTAIPK
ncbi:MAG: hypothetical protein ACXVXP_00485 [Mycobacteriaceae bacterium]